MKEGPRLYSNTWMAFVLAVASVLWLLNTTPVRGQSGSSQGGGPPTGVAGNNPAGGNPNPGSSGGGNSENAGSGQSGDQSQGQGNQDGNAGDNSQAGGQSQGQGNQGGNAGGNSQAGGQSGRGNQGGNAGDNSQAGGQSQGQGNQVGNAGGNSQAGNQSGRGNQGNNAGDQSQGQGNQGGNAGGNSQAGNQSGRGNQGGNAGGNSQASGQQGGRGRGPQGNNRGGNQPSGDPQANSQGSQQGAENGQSGNKDSLAVEALGSTGNGGSVSPATPSEQANVWRYVFCLPGGNSLNQTFPISFQLDDTNDTSAETADILLDAAGRLADAAIFDDEFSLSDDGIAETQNIQVDTEELQDGAYNLNLHIRARPQRRVHPPHATILIHVLVGAACSQPAVTSSFGANEASVTTVIEPTGPGFFTDSDYNALEKCDGEPASGASDGTFQIVARPKAETIVSTNPGQFYYNLIWPNTGAEQPVTIELSATNLNPKGRNAVHAMLFDSTGFVASLESWDMTNEDGTPCGPSGPCTVTVGAGKTLWVTWHLEYAGKGESSSGISSSCPGSETISATGTLKDSSGGTLATETATATGYLKE